MHALMMMMMYAPRIARWPCEKSGYTSQLEVMILYARPVYFVNVGIARYESPCLDNFRVSKLY